MQTSTSTPNRRRRGLRRFLFLAAAGLLGCLLWAEAPKRIALELAAGRLLGATVHITGLRLVPHLRADAVRVYDHGARDAALSVAGLDVSYRILPKKGRFVHALAIGRSEVFLDATNPTDTNYDFLLRLLRQPGRPRQSNPLPFLPENVSLPAVGVRMTAPEMMLRIEDLPANVTIVSLDDIAVMLQGNALRGAWRLNGGTQEQAFEQGAVDAGLDFGRRSLDFRLATVELPGLAQGSASALMTFANGAPHVAIDVKRLAIGALHLRSLLATFGLPPVQFDELTVADCGIDAVLGEPLDLGRVTGNVTAKTLRVGPSGGEWYTGDLALQFTRAEDVENWVELHAALPNNQQLTARVNPMPKATRATIAFDAWSREDLESALPVAIRPKLAHATTLERISATAELYWQSPLYRADARADVLLGPAANGPGETVSVKVEGKGRFGGTLPELFAGSISATLANQSIRCDVGGTQPSGIEARVSLTGVDMQRWARAAMGTGRPEVPAGILDGTVALSPALDDHTFFADLGLAASAVAFGSLRLPPEQPAVIQGTLLAAPHELRLRTQRLSVDAGEALSITATDAVVSLIDFAASGNVDAQFDAALLAGLPGLQDLWGEVALHIPLVNDKGRLSTEFTANATSLGYGDWTIPYGTALEAKGRLTYDTLSGTLRGESVRAAIGEGTVLQCEPWALATRPFSGAIPFHLTTDLAPVVAMGYLDAADGTATASGSLTLGSAGATLDAALNTSLASAVLPDRLALLTGCHIEAHAIMAEALSGTGTLRIDEVVTAGAHLHDLQGPLNFEGESLFAKPLTGRLFNGAVNAEVEAGLLKDGLPVTMTVHGTQLDLARLVEEVQPPRVTMSGIADATVTAQLNTAGVVDAAVTADAPGGISINRDFVQQLLLSQYTTGVKGGKQLGKVIQQVLGKGEQRPFDSAALNLNLVDGALKGEAALKSEALNLTIDLQVAPDALIAALKLSQEDVVRGIEDVTAQPLEWNE